MGSANLSTKRQRIAELARTKAGTALSTLHHVIDLEWMREAYRLTRKDGASGIDGVTAAQYEANLEANLLALLERIKSGRYVAPPVRRVYIPKADGSERPLGIPTLEDKVAQRAIVMVLEPIYEQEFLSCSFGFRPGRSAHQALSALRLAFMGRQGLRWVLDVDISKYYDTIQHHHLRAFLDRRVTDGVIRRMIDKWLKAGVLEHGLLQRTTEGTPQGGVVSPLLANIYLHHVLDEWFERDVRVRLRGNSILVRYADDSVMAFETLDDAKRVMDVLGKRLARYGLALHPSKTQLVDFRFHRPGGVRHPDTDSATFDFLGFSHIWAKSKKGVNGVRQVTAKGRYARALAAVSDWCRQNRHRSLRDQPVPDVARPLCLLRYIWQLSTHTMVCLPDRGAVVAGSAASWRRRVPLDPPQRDSQAPPASPGADRPSPLRQRERNSLVKNRMREICTSGSVRGGGGNVPTYSAILPLEWREVRDKGLAATQAVEVAEERQLTRFPSPSKTNRDPDRSLKLAYRLELFPYFGFRSLLLNSRNDSQDRCGNKYVGCQFPPVVAKMLPRALSPARLTECMHDFDALHQPPPHLGTQRRHIRNLRNSSIAMLRIKLRKFDRRRVMADA